ncbi:methyl-accepting chemotaxis protein [Idiomarina tyrosinivorans]|uniref:Methyl-accepting chemotaxis protein n=1 Tax=Idiomarina tyrosinivorans TaxID=1445662 RepID=A0A432ZS70_9GAMM|nr:methyl-accepting chemotaxis protein [Idiomarina tyrosinivorans]RUO80739.1 methyl-accepting chemotaxis protein [Idiomarina tyrosinivorans]
MNWFNNLNFRYKLLLPIVLLALALIGTAAVSMVNFTRVSSSVDAIVHEHLPGLNYLLQADRDLHQAQVAERTLLSLPSNSSKIQQYVDTYNENLGQAEQRVEHFANLTSSAKEQQMVKDYVERNAKWKEVSSRVIALHQQGRTAEAIQLSDSTSGELFQSMRGVLDELEQRQEESANVQSAAIGSTITQSNVTQLVVLIVGLAVCVLLAVFFPTLITRPLKMMLARFEDMAKGEGDLTARINLDRKDELGQVADAFNEFVAKLQTMIIKINEMTEQLATSSEQLSTISEQSNVSVKEQHQAVEQVATAIHEMSTTVDEIAKNANDAANAARSANQHTDTGRKEVNSTVEAIQSLSKQIDEITETIANVAEDSNNISKVLDVIGGIAEQTNLLALNAAIESARAGEHGRGFSVVADEVRTLASRTQASTQEIQDMIERLQQASTRAVTSMREGQENATKTVSQAQAADNSLEAITGAVAEINDMNSYIATAADEQSSVTEDINRNVTTITEISERSRESSSQVKEASDGLAQLSLNLQRELRQFRIH